MLCYWPTLLCIFLGQPTAAKLYKDDLGAHGWIWRCGGCQGFFWLAACGLRLARFHCHALPRLVSRTHSFLQSPGPTRRGAAQSSQAPGEWHPTRSDMKREEPAAKTSLLIVAEICEGVEDLGPDGTPVILAAGLSYALTQTQTHTHTKKKKKHTHTHTERERETLLNRKTYAATCDPTSAPQFTLACIAPSMGVDWHVLHDLTVDAMPFHPSETRTYF